MAERTPTGGPYYYLFDGHGSVTGLTDPSGNVAATYGYDPYGQLTSMTGGSTAVNNPWRYVSAYQDGTGLYKMGERYYDPSTGRFTQQDPVHNPLDPKSWNRYVYVGGDPVNFSDPTGLSIWSSIKKAVSSALDAVTCAVTPFRLGWAAAGWGLAAVVRYAAIAAAELTGAVAVAAAAATYAAWVGIGHLVNTYVVDQNTNNWARSSC